jgi:hypothetical protein
MSNPLEGLSVRKTQHPLRQRGSTQSRTPIPVTRQALSRSDFVQGVISFRQKRFLLL